MMRLADLKTDVPEYVPPQVLRMSDIDPAAGTFCDPPGDIVHGMCIPGPSIGGQLGPCTTGGTPGGGGGACANGNIPGGSGGGPGGEGVLCFRGNGASSPCVTGKSPALGCAFGEGV